MNGTRHWVLDAKWFAENGFVWPDDVENVSDAELSSIPLGRPAARKWNVDNPKSLVTENGLQMREIAGSFLHGTGIELGAASNPLPIPADCTVTYCDTLTYDELLASLYPGQSVADMIKPTIRASLEDSQRRAGRPGLHRGRTCHRARARSGRGHGSRGSEAAAGRPAVVDDSGHARDI